MWLSQKRDVPALPDNGPFREIWIRFTRWFVPCSACHKVAIVAGMPDSIHASIRMTDEDFQIVTEHAYYVNPYFSFDC